MGGKFFIIRLRFVITIKVNVNDCFLYNLKKEEEIFFQELTTE